MENSNDEIPAKRSRVEGHEKTQIPLETMLQVLLWLDRYDLDGKQITARCLRSLIENNQMPLRKVFRVIYNGEDTTHEPNTLSIWIEKGARDGPAKIEPRTDEDAGGEKAGWFISSFCVREVQLQIEADADVQKAASYLSSCFVNEFHTYYHRDVLPRNAIIAAPALIRELEFQFCVFDHGEEDTLSTTLNGSTFQSLSLIWSYVPVWQVDNERLKSLRLRGCNKLNIDSMDPYDDDETFPVTEEGMLSYCFTLDDGLTVPERRSLRITYGAAITPAFFEKVVEASKNSLLTCDVQLCIDHLQFDVGNLDLGVLPSQSREFDLMAEADVDNVRYNIADHGNGVRLLIRFRCAFGDDWDVTVRHGKKDHEEFFERDEWYY
ncbi:hypothetical protein AAVH_07376 [Aphelenchoides avenae]|nr:hypothetical protein AAVH_07376 [Aphelenchus avenae]